MVNGKTFYVHVILHQACFYYYYYFLKMVTNVLCLVTISIAFGCKQVCLEHCIAMFTQIITIAIISTFSAVQILKIAYVRLDPLPGGGGVL